MTSPVFDQFLALPTPDPGSFSGLYLARSDNYIIARDLVGNPILLISHIQDVSVSNTTYNLEGLEAILSLKARIRIGDTVVESNFAMLRCTFVDEGSRRYFLEFCAVLCHLLGPVPTASRIDDGINTFIRMFTLRSQPPRRSIIGLIGELLYIDQHANTSACIDAWHVSPRDLVDFNFADFGVEVKTTSAAGRFHRLSLEQVSGMAGKRVFLLSVRVIEVANGMTGQDLLSSIAASSATTHRSSIRLWELAAETMGADFQSFLEYEFSYESAVASICFFDAALVPAVRNSIPVGVTRISFTSNFDLSRPVSIEDADKILKG